MSSAVTTPMAFPGRNRLLSIVDQSTPSASNLGPACLGSVSRRLEAADRHLSSNAGRMPQPLLSPKGTPTRSAATTFFLRSGRSLAWFGKLEISALAGREPHHICEGVPPQHDRSRPHSVPAFHTRPLGQG